MVVFAYFHFLLLVIFQFVPGVGGGVGGWVEGLSVCFQQGEHYCDCLPRGVYNIDVCYHVCCTCFIWSAANCGHTATESSSAVHVCIWSAAQCGHTAKENEYASRNVAIEWDPLWRTNHAVAAPRDGATLSLARQLLPGHAF